LAVNQSLVRDSGARAREAFLRNYDLPIGVASICATLGVPLNQGSSVFIHG
jgi:hypothetical protein